MNLTPLDWLIVATMLGVLTLVALMTRRYTRSVAAFLTADRSAGRYLLTMASGMAGLGAITLVANFEQFYQAGFAAGWWGMMLGPVTLLVTLSGFVIYRYRETRAMTLAQFFERRYSRRFRIFAGIVAWGSGVINYGIFPGVTARCIIHFTGLPTSATLLGLEVSMLAVVMALMLSVALVMAISGGQIAIMITDFLQGQFVNIVMLAVMVLVLWRIGFSTVIEGLQMAPPGESRINPFDQGDLADFNVWYFVMLAMFGVYATMSWQGNSAYNASARTAHEAKMARILAEYRGMITFYVIMLLPVTAYAVMHLPAFAGLAESVQDQLAAMGEEQTRKQMLVPVVTAHLLPTGMMGLFTTVILVAAVSTDNTYLHSWGSIFVQDVVVPLRGRRLHPKTHLLLLRLSMVGVAAFAFWFSLMFPLRAYILMFFHITGAIYIGGAGAVIIGGLYWSRGTTAGAWSAMITGSVLATGGVVLQNLVWPALVSGVAFPFNGMQMSCFAAVVAMSVYILVSLATCRTPIDMDALLYRGRHAVRGDHTTPEARPATGLRSFGFTSEFTTGDKVIYLIKLATFFLFFGVFVIGTTWGLIWGIPDAVWIRYWWFNVIFIGVVGGATTVWFLIGGTRDLISLFRVLRQGSQDGDDGFVTNHLGVPDGGATTDDFAPRFSHGSPSSSTSAESPGGLRAAAGCARGRGIPPKAATSGGSRPAPGSVG